MKAEELIWDGSLQEELNPYNSGSDIPIPNRVPYLAFTQEEKPEHRVNLSQNSTTSPQVSEKVYKFCLRNFRSHLMVFRGYSGSVLRITPGKTQETTWDSRD